MLAHKSIQSTTIAPPDGYGSAAYRKIIPAGTVPAIDHDGFRLSDSEAIAEYLNELVPDPAMLPTDLVLRARAREISRFHDTRIEPVLRAYFGQVSPSNRDAAFVAENAALLQTRFDQLAEIADPAPLLAGDMLSIADCSFVASFAIMRCLQPILGFDLQLGKSLLDYEAALAKHPSVMAARADYIASLDQWATSKLSS